MCVYDPRCILKIEMRPARARRAPQLSRSASTPCTTAANAATTATAATAAATIWPVITSNLSEIPLEITVKSSCGGVAFVISRRVQYRARRLNQRPPENPGHQPTYQYKTNHPARPPPAPRFSAVARPARFRAPRETCPWPRDARRAPRRRCATRSSPRLVPQLQPASSHHRSFQLSVRRRRLSGSAVRLSRPPMRSCTTSITEHTARVVAPSAATANAEHDLRPVCRRSPAAACPSRPPLATRPTPVATAQLQGRKFGRALQSKLGGSPSKLPSDF